MTTPKTGAPELVESQADKEESVNEGLRRIEAGASLYLVVDKDLSAPPGSCADGAQYIVAATGSGAWVGHTGDIAIAVGVDAGSGWYFRDAEDGVFAWVQDENLLYYRSAGDSPGTWATFSAPGAIALDNLTDVDVSSSPLPTSGKVLTYNAPLGLWIPGAPAGDVLAANNLSDLASIPTARTNLKFDRVSSAASVSSPLAWNSDNYNQYAYTALSSDLTINADAGSPINGQKIIFRIKDDGTARALTWTTGSSGAFRAVGVTLPTTTVISKTVYVGCIYNAADSRWDAIALAQEA